MLEPSIYSPLVALPVMNVSNSLLDTWVLGDSPTSCLQAMFIIHEKVLCLKRAAWSSVIVARPWLWFCFHQLISSWFYLSPPSHLSVVSLPSWNLFVWKLFHAYDHFLCPQWYLEFFKTLTWSGNTEIKAASIKTEVSHGPLISSKYWSLIWWSICLGAVSSYLCKIEVLVLINKISKKKEEEQLLLLLCRLICASHWLLHSHLTAELPNPERKHPPPLQSLEMKGGFVQCVEEIIRGFTSSSCDKRHGEGRTVFSL